MPMRYALGRRLGEGLAVNTGNAKVQQHGGGGAEIDMADRTVGLALGDAAANRQGPHVSAGWIAAAVIEEAIGGIHVTIAAELGNHDHGRLVAIIAIAPDFFPKAAGKLIGFLDSAWV